MNITLGPRLRAIADFVPQGTRLADIGSDHGYLPAWLLLNERIKTAVAGELNDDPARRATETARAYGLTEEMEVRKGSGLTVLRPGEAETIVIAGMGGTTMTSILEEANPQVLAGLRRLILQPNVAGMLLRQWLVAKGWRIAAETLVEENEIVYEIIVAEPGASPQLDPWQAEFGPCLLESRPALLQKRFATAIEEREYILEQLKRSNSEAAAQKGERLREEIRVLREMMQ